MTEPNTFDTEPDKPDGALATGPPHEFAAVDAVASQVLMAGLRVRPVRGQHITLAVVELDPGLRMPEHRHPNEQVGMVLRGEFTFNIGGESRVRRPGDMWVIPPGVPHAVETTGESGCSLVETFSPPRVDWDGLPREHPAPGLWPPQ
jgi:quercetin dioxygenase-like cupin family protein